MRLVLQTRIPGSPSDVLADDSGVREVLEAAIAESAAADGAPVTVFLSPHRLRADFEDVLWHEYADDCDPPSQCWGETDDGDSWTVLLSGGAEE